jgi:hypothetical protein
MLIPVLIRAQNRVEGRVQEKSGTAVVGANLIVKTEANKVILTFAISKNDGGYTLTLPIGVDSLILEVKKMGFSTQNLRIENRHQNLPIILEKGDVELKEIIIKAPPIRRFGDTLSYQVDHFKSDADRSIGDVIKKLPGIEVDDNGKISYQGKPINRYYIDNLNLLGGQYGLANENLPHSKVVAVEVFENHQPIRILDSLQFSESAALNIKLKNRITKTGVLSYGIGGKPLLADLNVTPMVFVPQLQFLGSFKFNNVGENPKRQLMDHFDARSTEGNHHNWLSIPSVLVPPFSSLRWLDNHSYSGSVNALKKIKNDFEIKVNTSAFLDKQQQFSKTQQVYTLDQEISFLETVQNKYASNQFSVNVDLLKNTKANYFSNRFFFSKDWDTDSGLNDRIVTTFDQKNTSENIRLGYNAHKIWGGSINVYTQNVFQQTAQILQVSRITEDSVSAPLQEYKLKNFTSHTYLELIKRRSPKIRFNLTAGYKLEASAVQTSLQNMAVLLDTLNDFTWWNSRLYLSPGVFYSPGKWSYSLRVPISYNHILFNENLRDRQNASFSKVLAEPIVYLRFKPRNALELNISAGVNNALAKLGDMHSGIVMTNYLNFYQRDAFFRNIRNLTGGVGVNYNDVVEAFVASFNYNFTSVLFNLQANQLIQPDGTQRFSYFERNNRMDMHGLAINSSKYIFDLKSSIAAGLSYNYSLSERLINQQIGQYTLHTLSPSASVRFNGLKWLESFYQVNDIYFKRANMHTQQTTHKFYLGIYAVKNLQLRMNMELYATKRMTDVNTNSFLNLSLRYNLPKIRQEFELSVLNLTNVDTFRTIHLSEIIYQESIYQLRPRQFLIKGSLRL